MIQRVFKYIVFAVVASFIPALLMYQFDLLEKQGKTEKSDTPAINEDVSEALEDLSAQISRLNDKITSIQNKPASVAPIPNDFRLNLTGLEIPEQKEVREVSVSPHISISVVKFYFERLKQVFKEKVDCDTETNQYCRRFNELRLKYEHLSTSMDQLNEVEEGSNFEALLVEIQAMLEQSEFYYSILKSDDSSPKTISESFTLESVSISTGKDKIPIIRRTLTIDHQLDEAYFYLNIHCDQDEPWIIPSRTTRDSKPIEGVSISYYKQEEDYLMLLDVGDVILPGEVMVIEYLTKPDQISIPLEIIPTFEQFLELSDDLTIPIEILIE